MSCTKRFVSGSVFLIAVVFAAFSLLSLLTTEWYVSPSGKHMGIPSNCNDTFVSVQGVNVTFCQSFGFNSFANNVEKGLAGALLTSFILALLVASSLCLNCCSRTSGFLAVVMLIASFGNAFVCLTYYVYEKNRVTAEMSIGYSYYSCIFSTALGLCGGLLSLATSKDHHYRDYVRLD
ncbi:uncharacterized protein LOC135122020 [Zophobas morio]|uniref:uncharacterized protein LOC135122020 n=1 Tax=Zophobas morio TaxID=2755281 RepID=UPI00308332B2